MIETKFKSDECLFMLSVGMLLVDYFETIYKKLGLVLFNILLDCGVNKINKFFQNVVHSFQTDSQF